jgi:hypothetical protein
MNYKKIEILNELNNLSESITNYFAGQIQEFLGLTDFIEQMSSELRDFSSKVKLPKNYKPESPDNLDINPFYEVNSIFLSSMQVIPDKIDKEVLSLLKAFKEEFESDNKNVFFSLNSIIEEISSEQEVMKKIKSELDEEKKKNENFQNSQKKKNLAKPEIVETKYVGEDNPKLNIIKSKKKNLEKKKNIIKKIKKIPVNIIRDKNAKTKKNNISNMSKTNKGNSTFIKKNIEQNYYKRFNSSKRIINQKGNNNISANISKLINNSFTKKCANNSNNLHYNNYTYSTNNISTNSNINNNNCNNNTIFSSNASFINGNNTKKTKV